MKKIIFTALLLAGLFTNAQVITGTKGVFTNSPANGQTYATNAARVQSATVLSAGGVIDAPSEGRTFAFMDFPTSNMNTVPTVWLSLSNRNNYTRLRFYAGQDASSEFILYDKVQVQNFNVSDDGNNNIKLTMPKANSRVMIGTSSFTDGVDTYSLSVNGNVRADRVKVYTTWADYVFEEGYKLPTLEEVEQHIKEKGHLQDIPSAKEVEANGIELGEMNKLLLQKIEELTLYTIELKKQIEQVKAEVKTLKE